MHSRLDLIIAAAQAAGPCPPGEEAVWTERVRGLAVDLFVLGDTVDQDLRRLESAKAFTATMLAVRVEESSRRGVLTLRNTSGELEQPIRTDRGDNDAGRAMIERARALIGHRVRVYRLNEQMASNAKLQVRTVVHLVDYGPDTDPVPEVSAKQHIMQAAEGDKDAAQQAWAEAGLPDSGSVTARQLATAFTLLPGGDVP
ncbi:hypothetical protein M1P56_35105 (plasmid) [Streptomyces sp. HU2014]|uniref:hypothetical protein n=1 Tax=Streptomyces sp. HU2014 TaxID=2939414 RepID=UPI00200D60D8|nr:hypothetical protein [Streptomyces sp. HU2014]UQI49744.1 hypothetical protein M1P56_35105 [Streptomyces sp. HU2014]